MELIFVRNVCKALRYKSEGRGFDSRRCYWNFSFRPHYVPGVDSASNRNEYQEYFLGVKAAGASGWQPYHLHVPIVLKSGSLNLLEPSGPVQACNGIALKKYVKPTSIECRQNLLRVILFNLKGRQYFELNSFDRTDDDCKPCGRSWSSSNLWHNPDSFLEGLKKIKRTSVRVNCNTVANLNGCFQNTSQNHQTGAGFLGRIQIVDMLSLQQCFVFLLISWPAWPQNYKKKTVTLSNRLQSFSVEWKQSV